MPVSGPLRRVFTTRREPLCLIHPGRRHHPLPQHRIGRWSDLRIHDAHRETYDPKRSPLTLPLATHVCRSYSLPWHASRCRCREPAHACALASVEGQHHEESQIHAAAEKKGREDFSQGPLFECQTRQKGKQDGALGRNGLLVLHALIFEFLDYATGRFDPAIETIAQKAGISISSVKRGLAKLKLSGVLNWIRRAGRRAMKKAASV